MRRRNALSNPLAAPWCDAKSAVGTTTTNGKPPIALGLFFYATVAGQVGLPADSFHGISSTDSYWSTFGDGLTRVVERRFLGELIELENLPRLWRWTPAVEDPHLPVAHAMPWIDTDLHTHLPC